MKRLILCAVAFAAFSMRAAIPSLSELANKLTSLTEEMTSLTERYAKTTNALAETRARLDNATNTLARCLAAFNSTMELRRALHGTFVSTFITNAAERTIVRVDVYADGYEHTEKGHTRRYYTPEEMAERIANRKPKATLDDRIEAIRAEIARLEAVKNNGTNEVEAAHAIIALAARQKTLARLEASKTNVVEVIVTP